jgi:hypothetical protein
MIETRCLVNDDSDWPDLARVFRLQRHRNILTTGQVSEEIVYAIISLSRD